MIVRSCDPEVILPFAWEVTELQQYHAAFECLEKGVRIGHMLVEFRSLSLHITEVDGANEDVVFELLFRATLQAKKYIVITLPLDLSYRWVMRACRKLNFKGQLSGDHVVFCYMNLEYRLACVR